MSFVTLNWKRLLVSDDSEIHEYERLENINLKPSIAVQIEQALSFPIIQMDKKLEVAQVIILIKNGILYTVEPKKGIKIFSEIEERITKSQTKYDSPYDIAFLLLQKLNESVERVLNHFKYELGEKHHDVREMSSQRAAGKYFGISDISGIEINFATIADGLDYAMRAIDSLQRNARHLRRLIFIKKDSASSLNQEMLSSFIYEVEGNLRLAKFVSDRQIFLSRAVRDMVEVSDLNVIKIFNILWTVYIPGTAIVNWYGQNFTKMPELSWFGTFWTQLAATFILTVIPVWLIKQKGIFR